MLEPAGTRPSSYRNYLLLVLMVILATNFADRIALGLVLQDIKVDLRLSDSQLGFLSGIAFTVFYSCMGIPIARWADRGDRIGIIAITTAAWSVAVSLCGAAATFLQLLLMRMAVAVGEAGCIPPAHSLIADYFTRAERPRAVALYTLGIPLSLLLGGLLAGWLNETYGWRIAFVALGLPGLVVAPLAWMTLREPRRGATGTAILAVTSAVPLGEACRTLWHNRTFRHMLYCFVASFFFNYGTFQWQPAFFERSYGMHTGEIGSWFALAWGGCGLLGTYCGGTFASRYSANNEKRQLRFLGLLFLLFGIFSAGVYLAPNRYLALTSLGLASTAITASNGPFLAIVQTLMPAQLRATSVAVLYLFANLLGMGLGPLAAGMLSDTLRPWFGEESLRFALLALCPGFVWCVWHMWRASQCVTGDLARLDAFGSCEGERDQGLRQASIR